VCVLPPSQAGKLTATPQQRRHSVWAALSRGSSGQPFAWARLLDREERPKGSCLNYDYCRRPINISSRRLQRAAEGAPPLASLLT